MLPVTIIQVQSFKGINYCWISLLGNEYPLQSFTQAAKYSAAAAAMLGIMISIFPCRQHCLHYNLPGNRRESRQEPHDYRKITKRQIAFQIMSHYLRTCRGLNLSCNAVKLSHPLSHLQHVYIKKPIFQAATIYITCTKFVVQRRARKLRSLTTVFVQLSIIYSIKSAGKYLILRESRYIQHQACSIQDAGESDSR